jgi:photosystem II stability/assembly factor-like uncharacterized protein
LSVVSGQILWASGTKGTYLVTTDAGLHWRAAIVPAADSLDFRAVVAFDASTAYLVSSGEGDKSRLYKTGDGGQHWNLLFTDPDSKGFFDALAFWDKQHGIILGDPVNGEFAVFTTDDGGASWQRRQTPPALPDEGAFAASGTSLAIHGERDVWFGTGGPGAARVFHSTDAGKSWTVAQTGIRNDSKSAGIFSLAFSDALHGVAVGGDYQKPQDGTGTVAITQDGGATWKSPPGSTVKGYRSAVAFLPGNKDTWIAVGTSGSDVSQDGGRTWDSFSSISLNSVAAARDGSAWAVGPRGAVAKLLLAR